MAVPHSVHATPPPPLQRHGVKLKKLNRPADQRKAMLRSLTTELIRYGRIRSTLAKCKEVRARAPTRSRRNSTPLAGAPLMPITCPRSFPFPTGAHDG